MNNKVFINISSNDELITTLSNELSNKLKSQGLNVIVLPSNLSLTEKLNIINQEKTNALIITTELNKQNVTEIIYSLYQDNKFPTLVNNSLNNLLNIAKYYQLRSPTDTSKDYYPIIRDTKFESIIIKFEPFNQTLINNIVNILSNTIIDYLNKQNIYVIQKGDTIYSIARKFKITPNDIINANNLANYNLTIGQELIIPFINNENNANIPEGYESYIVKSGDSLYQIAKQFNTTIEAIKKASNITSNNLAIGQSLLIPKTEEANGQTYIVKSGDSLYQIAKRFNTTVEAIKKASNITSNNLAIGQTLIIP